MAKLLRGMVVEVGRHARQVAGKNVVQIRQQMPVAETAGGYMLKCIAVACRFVREHVPRARKGQARSEPCPTCGSASICYTAAMSKLSDLMEEVKRLSSERQRDVEHVLEAMIEGGIDLYVLSEEERDLIDDGLASRQASPIELESFRRRHKA